MTYYKPASTCTMMKLISHSQHTHRDFSVPTTDRAAYLVKDVSDVGLGLSKPHGEQLRTLDGDEVGLALVGNGFGQEGLTTARGAVEQDAFGRRHAKLQELLWVFHWVLVDTLHITEVKYCEERQFINRENLIKAGDQCRKTNSNTMILA